MSFSSSVLALEFIGPVATLWLDRPEKRIAFRYVHVAPHALPVICFFFPSCLLLAQQVLVTFAMAIESS